MRVIYRRSSFQAKMFRSSVNLEKHVERSASHSPFLLSNWTVHTIAWLLCIEFSGDWISWNMLLSEFLERSSNSGNYMINESVFVKSIMNLIYDYNLIEADEYPQDPLAWKKCIEEWKEKARKDKRIRKTPEEHCRNQVRRIVNLRARPQLCKLLLTHLRIRQKIFNVRYPKRIIILLEKLVEETTNDNSKSRIADENGLRLA